MEFAFPWPASQGEWLAWSSAVVTLLLGLLLFFAPALAFRILRLQVRPEKAAAIAEGRGRMSGFYLGVSLCCILLGPQPFLYMALGFSWLFTAFGRLLSMMSDGANTPFNWASMVVELVLAALPLAFVFGFVP
jgi:cytochrome c biogenesis protein CcdA